MEVFSLTAEDLTHLGGPMGTEYTTDLWIKYFSSEDKAIKYAEKNYKKRGGRETIIWKKKKNMMSSQDLGFVMYRIESVKLEQ